MCRAYGEVYNVVTNPTNTYKEAESVLHRTPQQVQTLLSWNVPLTPYKLWQARIWLPHSVFWDWHWILATRPYSNTRLVMGKGLSLLIVNYVKQRHSSDKEYVQKNYLSWFLKCCSADAAVCQRRGENFFFNFSFPCEWRSPLAGPGKQTIGHFIATYRFTCTEIYIVITLHTQGLFHSAPQRPDMTRRQSVIRNSSVFSLNLFSFSFF